jgi:hypothetical protein
MMSGSDLSRARTAHSENEMESIRRILQLLNDNGVEFVIIDDEPPTDH